VAPNSRPDRRWGVPGPRPDILGAPRPAHPHSAHILERAKVYYRWHPLFGLALPVRRRQRGREGESLLCESPDGRLLSLPYWMCNPECLQFSLGPPMISVDALRALRTLLGMCHTFSDCGKVPCRISHKEDGDEKIGNTAGPTDESVALRRDKPGSLRAAKGTDTRAGRTTYKRRPKKHPDRRGRSRK